MTHRCGLGGVKECGEIPQYSSLSPGVHHPLQKHLEVVLLDKGREVFAARVVVLVKSHHRRRTGRGLRPLPHSQLLYLLYQTMDLFIRQRLFVSQLIRRTAEA